MVLSISPENVLLESRKKIKREWICVFSGAMIFGLTANFYKMLNWLPNWDSLVFYDSEQDMTNLARPFLGLIDSFSSYYELPFLNGLLALFWIALSAVCIIEVLDIRRPVPAFLAGALLGTYPAVTSTMYFAYTADGYCFQMFLACLGVILAIQNKKGFLFTALTIFIICGTYPAYLSVAAVLWLLWAIKTLISDQTSLKKVITATLRFIAGVLLGGILFYIAFKLILLFKQVTVSNYQGIENALSASGLSPVRSMINSWKTFISVLFCDHRNVSVYFIANVIAVLILMLLGLRSLISIRKEENAAARIGLIILCALLLPAGCCVIYFISPYITYHALMEMGFSLIFVFLLWFYDSDRIGFDNIRKWFIGLLVIVMVSDWVVIANDAASVMVTAYERSYSYAVRLADRIDQTPGADEVDKIAIIGVMPDSIYHITDEFPMITGITDGTILIASDPSVDQDEVLLYMLRDYTGTNYTDAGRTAVEELKQDAFVSSMPSWPESGCVAVVGDTLVVKLKEDES